MKKVYLFALVSLLSVHNALAEDAVIARVTTAGGMPGYQETCNSTEAVLLKSGKIVVSRCGKNPKVVSQIADAAMENIITVAGDLKVAPLQLEHPEQPECADAPNTFYYVIQKGEKVMIQGEEDCRLWIMSGNRTSDTLMLLGVLEGMRRFMQSAR